MHHTFTPELYIKTTLYVHTVTSHCVSCKHVTGKKSAIAITVLSLVLYLCDY